MPCRFTRAVSRTLLSAASLLALAAHENARAEAPSQTLPALVVQAPVERAHRAARPSRAAIVRVVRPVHVREKPAIHGPVARATAATRAAQAAPPSLPILSRWSPTLADGRPAFVERFQLPNTVASVTRRDIDERVNIIDTEDAIKYLPSLFVRKRNDGDNQAVLATRTWGLNSSARSLVYADDVLLSALIGNDNTIGAPRWGLVAPEEIERIDFLYGPFSAAYPGNALGGVLQITTRMPDRPEMTAKQTESVQTFSLWNTNRTYLTSISSASFGDRINDFSYFVSGNFMDNHTQPLTFATTNNLFPWPGLVALPNKVGTPTNVAGALGQLDQRQVNAKLKLAYDTTPAIRATYQLGFWSSDSNTFPQDYLPGFGTAAGPTSLGTSLLQSFGGGYFRWQEQMLTNAVSVKSATNGIFDFDIAASNFSYLKSDQISPFSALPPYGFTQNGKDSVFGGTYWNNFDAKGIWRPDVMGRHSLSFGVHADEYHLNNPVWLTTSWPSGAASSLGVAASDAQGTTHTQVLWAQDAWQFQPQWKLTLGGRWENWTASGGYNQSLAGINALGTGWSFTPANQIADQPIFQPALHHARFSPKASLQWADEDWTVTGSIALANRFPTAKELYNLSTLSGATGVTVNPNPNLRPEVALSSEIAIERKFAPDGSVRLSLFNEEVRDAIIAQNSFAAGSTVIVSANTNISKISNRGAELAFRKDNFLIDRFELAGSATYVDSRILADYAWAGGSAANNDLWDLSPVGKNVPNVPSLRWTLGGTWRPDDHWSLSATARWQGRMWSTISNNDVFHGVYGSFDRFFVVDTKISYKLDERTSFFFGVDNINNDKYFLFHPFPQRTFTLSGRYRIGASRYDDIGIFKTPGGGS
jgi:iron complex outermembrane receptor protein